jgi:BirA family transcriptional regulator, biotin operon repressor / biotin---[acetyl-CoA-carboxylase] ligase
VHFENYYRHIDERTFIDPYKARSFLLGHEVDVMTEGHCRVAYARAIDADLRLIVSYEDGSEEALSTGEVSVHLR